MTRRSCDRITKLLPTKRLKHDTKICLPTYGSDDKIRTAEQSIQTPVNSSSSSLCRKNTVPETILINIVQQLKTCNISPGHLRLLSALFKGYCYCYLYGSLLQSWRKFLCKCSARVYLTLNILYNKYIPKIMSQNIITNL